MELLAPAGNVDNFYAAVQAGADGVYIGAPRINARNLSRDLRFEEIGAMIEYGREHGIKVYLAANSLLLEREISEVLETLSLLEALEPDALIVQDVGLLSLVRRYFPQLRLHASTLMGGYSSESVRFFEQLGCERVVLARELTLQEITGVAGRVKAELEIFVHGAMCYSYSGLCLFSSFLGGKSSMRGRCVQPCRRAYGLQGQGGKKKSGRPRPKGGNYLFSMNDLAGFEAVPHLKKAGVASLKIEGRLRSANYVSKVVEAYRLVLDTPEEDLHNAIGAAQRLAVEAMGRKTSTGYFFSPQPPEAITPQHSGNMGLHLGRFTAFVEKGKKVFGDLTLKYDLYQGDRLRLHVEAGGERKPFTLHQMVVGNQDVEFAPSGTRVRLALPVERSYLGNGRVELYKLDVRHNPEGERLLAERVDRIRGRLASLRREQNSRLQSLRRQLAAPKENLKRSKPGKRPDRSRKSGKKNHRIPELWVKTDSAKLAMDHLPFEADRLVLVMSREMLSSAGSLKKQLGKKSRHIIWALPPVVLEREIGKYRKQINQLLRGGYRNFQLGHPGQLRFFDKKKAVLYADYTFNLSNSQALAACSSWGVEGAQVSIELDRSGLEQLLSAYRRPSGEGRGQGPKMRLGMTVYGAPPLFTSRLSSPHFQFNKTVVSPKGEHVFLKKREGTVLTIPEKPFSLLPYLAEIYERGLDYAVVDITGLPTGGKEMATLAQRIAGTGKYRKLPTFNYLGNLE